MNQRLKRKIEKRRRQQICEALDLCLQINGLQKSEKELTGNHPTAIMHFWGHIGMVDGDFYASGWSREAVVPDILRSGWTGLGKWIRSFVNSGN